MFTLRHHHPGMYYKKIQLIFTIFSAVLAIIIAFFLCIFLSRNTAKNYQHSIAISQTVLEEKGISSFKEISSTMTNIVNDSTIRNWADSEGNPNFYLLSVQAKEALMRYSTSTQTQCNIYLILDNPNISESNRFYSEVLSSKSTFALSQFLQQLQLSEEAFEKVRSYFDTNLSPYVLPHYDSDGKLSSLYYFIKGYRQPQNCIYMADIPVSSLIGNTTAEQYWIFNEDGVFIPNSTQKSDSVLFHQLQKLIVSDDKIISAPEHYIAVTDLLTMNWKIAYLYDKNNLIFTNLLLFVASCILIFLTLNTLLHHLIKWAYQPLYTLLAPYLEDAKVHNKIDELQIMSENLEKVQSLNKSLMEVHQTTNALLAQQYCRDLLTDPNGYLTKTKHSFFSEASDFCVCLICLFQDEDSDGNDFYLPFLELYKNLISQKCIENPDIAFVNLSLYRCGLIIKASDLTHAKFLVNTLISQLSESDSTPYWDSQFILSHVQHGLKSLHDLYSETLKIEQYLPILNKEKILTYDQIAEIDSSTYSYPLSAESKLIQELIDGEEDALLLFDNLIRENLVHKFLPMEVLQNFVYVLIGTVNRAFQELKTTPEEYISRSIDYEHWYANWSDSIIIREIRSVFSDIISEKKKRTQTQNNELISQMLDYIHKNYQDDIMLNDLADVFNISPKYCSILFKQLSNSNFKDYLNSYRIEQAKKFLQENPALKTKDLSNLVGFNSSNTFIRVFGKYTGTTPQKYADYILSLK